MLEQEFLVERAVVVIIVAAGGGARFGLEILVRETLFRDIAMADHAMILGNRDADRLRDLWLVLDMAGDALGGSDFREHVGIARIGEKPLRMRIVGFLQLRAVAFDAGFLQSFAAGKSILVAGLASELDLMMAVTRFAGKKQLFVRQRRIADRVFVPQDAEQVSAGADAENHP